MLCPGVRLRGWIGMPYAAVRSGDVKRLGREQFEALLLCDGQTDISMFSEGKMSETLSALAEEGLICFCDTPGRLEQDQYYKHVDNRYFHGVYWAVTGRCNFRCRHCYLDAPDVGMGEMTHEEALSVVDQMAECGVNRLIISGGEPLVRADLWDLIDRAVEKGIMIDQVYTNGWLLTDKVLDAFEAREVKPEFSISFDGAGWHDWMRGVKGAEKAALDALRRCRDRGFATNVEMCVHKGNKDSIRESLRVLAETGTGSVKMSEVSPTDLWRRNAEGNAMTTAEYYDAVLRYIPCFFEDGMPIDVLFGGVVWLYKGSGEYKPVAEFGDGSEDCLKRHICGAVRSSCYIAPDGLLLPCMPIAAVPDRSLFPRIQDIGLRAALKDSFFMEFADRRVRDLADASKTCRECPYLLRCGGGCRACAVMGGERDLMGPDPSRCMMWKGGWLQKLHDVCDAAIAKFCRGS